MWNSLVNKIKDINNSRPSKKVVETMKSCTVNDAENVCKDITAKPCSVIIGENLYRDIEMIEDYNGRKQNTVLSTFDPYMKGSRDLLQKLLENPQSEFNILQARKRYLEELESSDIENILPKLNHLSNLENDVLWIFIEKDENLKDLFDIVYFKWSFLKFLNASPTALTISNFYKILVSPIIGIMSPIIYFVIPYMVLGFKFKIKISFFEYLRFMYSTLMSDTMMSGFNSMGNYKWMKIVSYLMSLIFYFQGVFNSVELARTFHKISSHITSKINNVADFAQTARCLIDILWQDDAISFFFDFDNVTDKHPILQFPPKQYSLFSNFGVQLSEFKKLDMSQLKCIVTKVYVIDALMSIIRFKSKYQACFVDFKNDNIPSMSLNNTWHPCLDKEKAVANNISLAPNMNMIITGPNAGGKSTFIKTVLINVIFAQTVCISVASNMSLNPFAIVNSQINIPDTKGKESLFEAEMYRCKRNLDLLKEHKGKPSLIVLDEIFNSTNPIEGIAGAFAIGKKMSEFNNCLLIFTTHYAYLTKLEKRTRKFINYRMNIKYTEGDIIYPYKLERGVSKQYIALELLRKNGFDQDIIDDALELKKRFVSLN